MSSSTVKLKASKLCCAKCEKYLSNPPVFVQSTGDSICEDCYKTLGDVPYYRNYIYEAMVKDAFFPCVYAANGCPTLVQFNKTNLHESICVYKHNSCPIELCGWSGRMMMLHEHVLSNIHGAQLLTCPKFIFGRDSEVFKLFKWKKRTFLMWVDGNTDKIRVELINLDMGDSVKYTFSVYRANAKNVAQLRKGAKTRLFTGKMREVLEFDKKVLCTLLGDDIQKLECSFYLDAESES